MFDYQLPVLTLTDGFGTVASDAVCAYNLILESYIFSFFSFVFNYYVLFVFVF